MIEIVTDSRLLCGQSEEASKTENKDDGSARGTITQFPTQQPVKTE